MKDYKKLPLTQGQCALVSPEDYASMACFSWYADYDAKSGKFYAKRWTAEGFEYLHRRIAKAPDNRSVDHRNGNTLDCRRSNLRAATASQNAANRPRQRNGSSGFKGVSGGPGHYRAQIQHRGRQMHLGTFATKAEAARAYDLEARRLFGEFAFTNFPSVQLEEAA